MKNTIGMLTALLLLLTVSAVRAEEPVAAENQFQAPLACCKDCETKTNCCGGGRGLSVMYVACKGVCISAARFTPEIFVQHWLTYSKYAGNTPRQLRRKLAVFECHASQQYKCHPRPMKKASSVHLARIRDALRQRVQAIQQRKLEVRRKQDELRQRVFAHVDALSKIIGFSRQQRQKLSPERQRTTLIFAVEIADRICTQRQELLKAQRLLRKLQRRRRRGGAGSVDWQDLRGTGNHIDTLTEMIAGDLRDLQDAVKAKRKPRLGVRSCKTLQDLYGRALAPHPE